MDRQQLLVMDTEHLIAGAAHPACVLVCATCGGHSVFIDTPVDHEVIRRDWVQIPYTGNAPVWVHVVCPATIDTRSDVEIQLDREWELAGREETDVYRRAIVQIREAMENGELPKPRPVLGYVGEYDPWRDAPDDPGMCFCARFGYHHRPGGW